MPLGISRTPIRGRAPAGAQMEYDRRCSTPSIDPAHGERLPGREVVGLPQVLGHVEGDRDAVVGQPLDVGDGERVEDGYGAGGRLGGPLGGGGHSDLLHVLERLEAGRAPVERLARGRAELRGELDVGRAAPRAGDRAPGGQQVERRPAPAAGAAPGGEMPCSASLRRPSSLIQSLDQAGVSSTRTRTSAYPASREPVHEVVAHGGHRRAAGVRRRDRHLDPVRRAPRPSAAPRGPPG